MKKRIVLIVFFLYFFNHATFSQDLSNLDMKFGFNKFKLESSYEMYKSKLTPRLTSSGKILKGYDGVKYYDYTGEDIKLVFGAFVKIVNLGFFNNKLYTISVEFIATSDEDENRIKEGLKDLFGYQPISSDSKYDWALSWETDKTYLQVCKHSCLYKYDPCRVEMFLFSKKLRAEVNNNQF